MINFLYWFLFFLISVLFRSSIRRTLLEFLGKLEDTVCTREDFCGQRFSASVQFMCTIIRFVARSFSQNIRSITQTLAPSIDGDWLCQFSRPLTLTRQLAYTARATGIWILKIWVEAKVSIVVSYYEDFETSGEWQFGVFEKIRSQLCSFSSKNWNFLPTPCGA